MYEGKTNLRHRLCRNTNKNAVSKLSLCWGRAVFSGGELSCIWGRVVFGFTWDNLSWGRVVLIPLRWPKTIKEVVHLKSDQTAPNVTIMNLMLQMHQVDILLLCKLTTLPVIFTYYLLKKISPKNLLFLLYGRWNKMKDEYSFRREIKSLYQK